LGRVALWGTVIECQRGFRASYAYPVRIYVPADAGDPWHITWEEVAFGLARYGVPVEPLAARASEATDHLAERLAARRPAARPAPLARPSPRAPRRLGVRAPWSSLRGWRQRAG